MSVYTAHGKAIHLGERAGAGGEATVYRIMGQPEQLAKIYQPGPRPDYPTKLAWMLAHPPDDPTSALGHASLAWPSELLFASSRPDDAHLLGYLMPFVSGSIPIISLFNPRLRARTIPQFDRRYLHRAARNLAAALGALHSRGYVVGDLNESNILVMPSALVTLIDTDSFQVQEQEAGRSTVHYCPVGKLEYTPPELQGQPLDQILRLPEHDAFGLGVLIFQLLMEGNHPFRAQWLGKGEPPSLETRIAQGAFPYVAAPDASVKPPANAPELNFLHPRLAELMRRCFADGHSHPERRPTTLDWELAIAEAEKSLVRCPRGHIYSNHLLDCPQCRREAGRTRGGAAGASHPAGQARGVHRSRPMVGVPRTGAAPAAAATARTGAPPAGTRQSPAAPHPAAGHAPAQPARGTTGQSPAAQNAAPKSGAGQSIPAQPNTSPGTAHPAANQAAPGMAHQQPAVPLQTRLQQMAWEWAKRQAKDYIRTQVLGMPPAPPNRAQGQASGTAAPSAGATSQPAGASTRPAAGTASNPGNAPTGTGAAGSSPGSGTSGAPGPGAANPGAAVPGAAAAASATASPPRASGSYSAGTGPVYGQTARTQPAASTAWRPGAAATATPPQAAPAHSTASATSMPRPVWGIPTPGSAAASPATTPARPGGLMRRFSARPPVEKIFLRSIGYGAGQGLLAGVVPAVLAAIIVFLLNQPPTWVLLAALGGAAGGAVRGWQPGRELSDVVTFSIGWRRLLQAAGALTGAALGALLSLPLIWAILPILAGVVVGGMLGFSAGRKTWELGLRIGWERISVGLTTVFSGVWGASIVRWLALTPTGSQTNQWAIALTAWVTSQTASPLLASAAAGLLAGALGGAIGGFLVDLSARIFRLTE